MQGIFSKILVCCDGSKYSEKAIQVACNLAKTYDSDLTLIHVIDKTPKSDILAGSEYTEILRKYAKEVIEKAIDRDTWMSAKEALDFNQNLLKKVNV